MDLSELEALFLKRQSCREFSEKPLDAALLKEICRVALLAPSAVNAQPWQLIAVTGGEKRTAVLQALQHLGMNKFASKAAALVAIAEDKGNFTGRVAEKMSKNEFVKNDLGILTAHLVLAAEAAGVGSCILGWRDEAELRTVLGVEEHYAIPVVVALGYPAEGYEVRPKKRRPLEEVFTLIS